MKLKNLLFFTFLVLISCSKSSTDVDLLPAAAAESVFYKGMDLSFQPEQETYNVVYKNENNTPISVLPFIKQKGCNLVRLKLWVNSSNGYNTLNQVKAYALRLKSNGLGFMLDLHYSDTWADPSWQSPPAAWQNLTLDELKTQVYTYTKQVLTEFKNQGTVPEFVQIGNETDTGFLWNYGKVWNQYANNFVNFSALFNKGSQAVREVCGTTTKLIFHHSSADGCFYFLNQLSSFPIDYDVIGVSYYPQFQTKDLVLWQSKLNLLASSFNKEVMVVEVAYPFTTNFNDNLTNFIGSSNQIIPEYAASPQGQKEFLQKIITIIKAVPNKKGIGFVYWAPDWISFSGNAASSMGGSSWENQCLWDFNNKALPAFDVYQ